MPRIVHYSDVETAYDTPERMARVAGCLCELAGPDTLLAGSGDNTGPGVLSLVSEGRQALEFFGTVDPDVETVGNHDLDHGVDALFDVVGESPQSWVLANVDRDGSPLGRGRGLDPWTTVQIGGLTVGVTGVVDPATPEMTPGLDDLTFRDPVAAVDTTVETLREAGASTVVVLAHTDTATAEAIAKRPTVDAVLAGHEHEPCLERIDGTPLSRPGATGRQVVELDLESGSLRRHDTAEFEKVDRLERALAGRTREAGLDEVVATVEGSFPRDRSSRSRGEWRLGNFVADAYRWAAGTDVGLQNTGGIRDGPPVGGEVTRGDLIGLSPFEEPVVVAELSGDELVDVAHEADGRRLPSLPDRWAGHVSGMAISPDGSDFAVSVDGLPVDPDGTYTVATPRYLLRTDREFPTLTPAHRAGTIDRQYEVIVDYAREEGIDPSLDGRIPQ